MGVLVKFFYCSLKIISIFANCFVNFDSEINNQINIL